MYVKGKENLQRKKVTKIIIGIIIIVTCLGGAIALSTRNSADDFTEEYELVEVKEMNLSETIDATGKVLSLEKKDLYADYEGFVNQVKVKAGDNVKKGDILLTITSSALKEQWQAADSALKQAELNLALSTGQLATELGVNQVSEKNLLQVENYTHQVAIYREQVKQAKDRLAVLNAKNDGYYVANNEELMIRAPFDGQVAWIHTGRREKVTPQTLLATVVKPDALGVEAQIDENDINRIKKGQNVVALGNDEEQAENTGVICEVGTLGQEIEEVVYFPVRIELTDQTKGLLPGMTVDVTVTVNERKAVLAVPAGSVVTQNGRDYVNVRHQDKLMQVPVEIGLRQGKFWEVKSGLSAGTQVAVAKPEAMLPSANVSGFRPGVRVRR